MHLRHAAGGACARHLTVTHTAIGVLTTYTRSGCFAAMRKRMRCAAIAAFLPLIMQFPIAHAADTFDHGPESLLTERITACKQALADSSHQATQEAGIPGATSLKLLGITPAAGSTVKENTLLVVDFAYSVKDFEPKHLGFGRSSITKLMATRTPSTGTIPH